MPQSPSSLRLLPRVAVDLEVPFHDVDPLRIAWHGHYAKYFELARTVLLRSRRLDVPDFVELGYRLYMGEMRCRFIQPLRYGELFRVEAWFKEIEPRLLVAYRITEGASGRLCTRAHTTLVFTDHDGKLLMETPRAILDRLLD